MAARSARSAAVWGAVSMVPMGVLLHFMALPAARFFAPDPAVAASAASYLRTVSWSGAASDSPTGVL